MRSFVLRAVLFGLLLALVVMGFGSLDNLRRWDEANKVRLSVAPDSLDVLCVGSSYTYSGVYTPAFAQPPYGLRAYNYGFSAAGPKVYRLVLDDYLRRASRAPRVVLLNVSPVTFCPTADQFTSYPIHRYLTPPLSPWQLWGQGYATWADAQTMQAKSLMTGLQNAALALLGREQDSALIPQTQTQAGFYANGAVCTDSTYRADSALYARTFGQAQFGEAALKQLIETAQMLQAQGIRVILHEVPTYRLAEFLPAEFRARYQAVWPALQAQGFTVLRCSPGAAVPVDGQYFRNLDHLNTPGAEHYTAWLLAQLRGQKAI